MITPEPGFPAPSPLADCSARLQLRPLGALGTSLALTVGPFGQVVPTVADCTEARRRCKFQAFDSISLAIRSASRLNRIEWIVWPSSKNAAIKPAD